MRRYIFLIFSLTISWVFPWSAADVMDSNQLPIATVDDAAEEPRYHGDYDRNVTMQDIQATVSSRSPWSQRGWIHYRGRLRMPSQFLKTCKIFKSCSDGQFLSAILIKAISANVFSSPSTMTEEECIALITWMKSAAGQKIVQGVHKQVKLEKMTIRVLQLQMQDYGNSAKKHASGDHRKAIDAEFLLCAFEFVEPTKKELAVKSVTRCTVPMRLLTMQSTSPTRRRPLPHCGREIELRMESSGVVHAPVCARGGSEERAISLVESED